MGYLGFIPALVGMALGLGSIDRRLSNPPIIWIGAIWNIVIVVLWLLLVVIGTFMG